MDCIFCAIAVGDLPADIIAQDEHAVAFLDLHPTSAGHTLVIPRRHVADLAEDSSALVEATGLVAELSGRLQQQLGADAMNLVVNSGELAGQEVFHLHVHLVPRYRDQTAARRERAQIVELLTATT